MFHHQISYVVVAQSSRRSPARLEVVSSKPVEGEFFFLFLASLFSLYIIRFFLASQAVLQFKLVQAS